MRPKNLSAKLVQSVRSGLSRVSTPPCPLALGVLSKAPAALSASILDTSKKAGEAVVEVSRAATEAKETVVSVGRAVTTAFRLLFKVGPRGGGWWVVPVGPPGLKKKPVSVGGRELREEAILASYSVFP